MRIRDAVLAYQETQASDKASKTINLDIVDPVSALGFEFEAQNGTTNNKSNPLTRCITKLEVVDGSDVLASMSFEQAQALQFYKTGKQPELREDEGGASGSVIGCQILFGRYLYDQEYAMDFTKFKNPQLKISWDLTVIRAVHAATAFATGTTKVSAWAKIMEDMPTKPNKYLMDKEIESWTGATAGDKRHELPTDHVYRMLILRTYLTQKDVDENISKIKITADTDKFIVLERYTKQWDAEMAQLFGNCLVWKRHHSAHNATIWLPINKEPQLSMDITVLGYKASYGWCWSGEAQLLVANAAGAADTTDRRIDSRIEGHALHATVPIPLGLVDKPETWFDPKPYKKLELVTTEAQAAANSIVAEQVRLL